MKFEDMDEQFEFEKEKRTSKKTKIRVATLFIVFIIIIAAIANNNFSFVFGAGEKFKKVCGPGNTRKARDDNELVKEKAKSAVASNLGNLKKIEGFFEAYAEAEPIGYKNKQIPVIKVIFNYEDDSQDIVPKELCNFDVKVLYK